MAALKPGNIKFRFRAFPSREGAITAYREGQFAEVWGSPFAVEGCGALVSGSREFQFHSHLPTTV